MSSPELAIAITTHRRPHYLTEVIESWSHTDWERYPTVFQCEPDYPDVYDVARRVPHAWAKLNPVNYGALGNPWYAIQSGFDLGAEFVVLGEDDSIVAPDILDYFLAAKRKFQDYQKVFTVCSFVRDPVGEPYEFVQRDYFASVIWGVWRDRWESDLKENWGWDYSSAWDGRIIERLRGKLCVFPGHSRSQHIGQYDGTHMMPHQYDEMKSMCFYTAQGGSWA